MGHYCNGVVFLQQKFELGFLQVHGRQGFQLVLRVLLTPLPYVLQVLQHQFLGFLVDLLRVIFGLDFVEDIGLGFLILNAIHIPVVHIVDQ